MRCSWAWAIEVAGMDGVIVGLEGRLDFGAVGAGPCCRVVVHVSIVLLPGCAVLVMDT
jgi:hypothetical protein